jgi:dihydroorotase
MLIYENPLYVAPNLKRHLAKAEASQKYKQRIYQKLSYEHLMMTMMMMMIRNRSLFLFRVKS